MMRISLSPKQLAAVNVTSPAERIIDLFGGLTQLARELQCPVSTVQGWKSRGKVPQEYWLPIIEAGQQRSLAISAADFLPPMTAEAFDAMFPPRPSGEVAA